MSASSPVISVVMPAFNVGPFIKESIASTLDQTFSDFELIIINDGSTDNTEEEIKKFTDPRILYIKNEKNLNLANSLNKAMRVAKGKYIARMDADDISAADRLEKQYNFLEKNLSIGICGSQLEVFGMMTGHMNYPLKQKDLLLRLLITSCFGNNVVMFRKKILEEHDLYFDSRYTCADDYECWTRWLLVTEGLNFKESLMKYRVRSNSLSQNRLKQRSEIKDIRKKFITRLFGLSGEEANKIAENFYGPLNFSRTRAIREIVNTNRKLNLFPEADLKETIDLLWYADSLTEVEERRMSVFLNFPLILRLSFTKNISRYLKLFKHFYITSRPPYRIKIN
ncbi:MAG: glycosyltransferase [Bacteroidia bacterium]